MLQGLRLQSGQKPKVSVNNSFRHLEVIDAQYKIGSY